MQSQSRFPNTHQCYILVFFPSGNNYINTTPNRNCRHFPSNCIIRFIYLDSAFCWWVQTMIATMIFSFMHRWGCFCSSGSCLANQISCFLVPVIHNITSWTLMIFRGRGRSCHIYNQPTSHNILLILLPTEPSQNDHCQPHMLGTLNPGRVMTLTYKEIEHAAEILLRQPIHQPLTHLLESHYT